MAEPVLAIRKLSVAFRSAEGAAPVLREIDLTLAANEIVGLVGESGSGKSTVLFAIMSDLAENAVVQGGAIRYRGVDLLHADRPTLDTIRGRRIAMVFQDPGAALNPSIVVGEQIAEALRLHLKLGAGAARARTLDLLRQVRLDDPERVFAAYPHQLSGGMRQRAMIAMALSCEPDVLLMDEPTTGLDVIVQAHILALIRTLRSEVRAAILFVSHDIGAVAQIADRIGVLYAGELMELGPADAVLTRSRNPYTRGLLAAVPRLSRRTALRAIPGSTTKDPGRFARCVFAERCAHAAAICRETRPTPTEVGAGHRSRCHFAADLARIGGPREALAVVGDGAAEATPPLLRVEDLVVEYRRGGLFMPSATIRAVDRVSLTLPQERVLAVVGESGSGKSTLARAILRLEPARSGRILFRGEDVAGYDSRALRRFRRGVQMVFQNPTSSLNPRKTVAELVARPLTLAGVATNEARDRARAMLAAVGLGDAFLDRYPRALSGGEKQRVALARAFVTEPALVILDEPTTALDVSVQATVLDLLQRLKARARCSYLLISHDLAVVRQLADEIVVMRAGKVCEAGPAAQVLSRPSHDYTSALIAAVPEVPAAAE